MKINQRCLSGIPLALLLVSFAVAGSDKDPVKKPAGKPRPAAASNQLYSEECGSCHMAYPPGLLPARDWENIMNNLQDHYGDNAELSADRQKEITVYLQKHGAAAPGKRESAGAATLPRISTQPRFLHEHDEIPSRLSTGNPQVKSFSNCEACHERAEQGSFREDEIRIPGYGRWDD